MQKVKEMPCKYNTSISPPILLGIAITIAVGFLFAVAYFKWYDENFNFWGII